MVNERDCTKLQSLNKTRIVEEFLSENSEILRHKWIESEREGKDVGYARARVDWIIRFRSKWASSRGQKRREGEE